MTIAPKSLSLADLYCGAGGTSHGATAAIRDHGFSPRLTAVNHWPVAVATHSANFAEARHLCASLDALNPRDLFKPRELWGLWGSPECIHHSRARGSAPINDQSRATAWCMVRWAEALLPEVVWAENVSEFQQWGPLGSNGKPLKSRRGETFDAWRNAFHSLGYKSSVVRLCAADYGDPTTRERLFVQFVRGRRNISWPSATHSKIDGLFAMKKWRAASEIIDWKLLGTPLSQRKRPLTKTTMDRIRSGLKKFGGEAFILAWDHQGGGDAIWPLDMPLSTITTKARHGVVQPFIVTTRGTSKGHIEASVKGVDEPLGTITTSGRHHYLAEPFLVQTNHEGGDRVRSVDDPLPTVCGNRGEWAICDPFVISYYGNSKSAASVREPLDTVTTKDRFALCEPGQVNGSLDVRFRMLQPHELAAAQGFPSDYKFTGTKSEVVKQIGNAVPCGLSYAIVKATLEEYFGKVRAA